jgi:hypothetical protein
VPDDLLIALNPEEDSSLPYLVRIPLGAPGIVVKTRDTWPRTSKVYCHRAAGWPADAEVILRVPVRRCTRRGAAIDLVLDRARENRSQFVITRARGREMIFWQSPKTTKQARPGVHIPTARGHGQVLEISIDSGEKYPYRFSGQQATTVRERLACGDYAVQLAGNVVAAVERKTANDLISSMISGRMRFLMAELAALPRSGRVRHPATGSAEAGCHPDLGAGVRIGCAGQGTDSTGDPGGLGRSPSSDLVPCRLYHVCFATPKHAPRCVLLGRHTTRYPSLVGLAMHAPGRRQTSRHRGDRALVSRRLSRSSALCS